MANETKNNMTIRALKLIDCDICGNERKSPVKCRYCEFSCCTTCFDKYLLTTPGDSKCMNCKAIYDTDTIYNLCSSRKKTYTAYTEFKLNQIIEREKSLFQETLVEIENEREQKKRDKYRQMGTTTVDKAYDHLQKFQMTVLEMASIDETIATDMLSKVGMSLKYIRNLRPAKLLEIRQNINNVIGGRTEEEKKEEMKKNTFIKNCSMPNCKGTLNNRWNCRLCETSHCSKCGEKKVGPTVEGEGKEEVKAGGDVHVCDPNMVQSMEEIKKNSKPCPKCGVCIYKTEGCDQMFCIVCHTAFSWKTLEIETGRIHNPHYYEIMRKNGEIRREDGDVRPCDELVNVNNYWEYLMQCQRALSREAYHKLEETFRFVTELEQLHNERNFVITNRTFLDIRKKYLLNQIDGSTFRTNIKRKNTIFTKNFERCQVLGVTKIAMSEEIKRLFINEAGERRRIITERIVVQDGVRRLITDDFLKLYIQFDSNIQAIIENTNNILEKLGAKYSTPHSKIKFDTDPRRHVVPRYIVVAESKPKARKTTTVDLTED